MSLIVQKYGGTSVGSIELIERVAGKVIATKEQGHQVVVVVSAMSGETNRLVGLANEIQGDAPRGRELDVLLSTGEQVTIALLAMALQKRGCAAVSSTGRQLGILTDNKFNKARIKSINGARLKKSLDEGYVVVVQGFKGSMRKATLPLWAEGAQILLLSHWQRQSELMSARSTLM